MERGFEKLNEEIDYISDLSQIIDMRCKIYTIERLLKKLKKKFLSVCESNIEPLQWK